MASSVSGFRFNLPGWLCIKTKRFTGRLEEMEVQRLHQHRPSERHFQPDKIQAGPAIEDSPSLSAERPPENQADRPSGPFYLLIRTQTRLLQLGQEGIPVIAMSRDGSSMSRCALHTSLPDRVTGLCCIACPLVIRHSLGAEARVCATPLTFQARYGQSFPQSFLTGRPSLGGPPGELFWRTPGVERIRHIFGSLDICHSIQDEI